MHRQPSDEQLDAYILGLATKEEAAVVDDLVATSATFAAALAARRAEHQDLNVERGLAKLRDAVPRPRTWSFPRLVVPFVAIAACCLAFVIASTRVSEKPQAGVRLRGDINVRVVAQRGGDTFAVDGEGPLRAGDRLRFVTLAPGYNQVAVIGFDAGGAATVYPDGASSTVIGESGALPFAIELDAASGAERFAIVVAKHPFAPVTLVERLRHDEHLVAMPEYAVAWRTIAKDPK